MEQRRDVQQRLEAELADATAQLNAHMASWEYAFAMGGGRDGSGDHPLHWETHARTERLAARRRSLRAQLAEFEA
jgi:hypothetical protein